MPSLNIVHSLCSSCTVYAIGQDITAILLFMCFSWQTQCRKSLQGDVNGSSPWVKGCRQPTVVLVEELSAVSAAYAVFDNTTWQVQTAVKAVDICFKAYHVLHAQYPVESHVWMQLQRLVFGLSTKWDAVSPTVSAVLSDLSKNLFCRRRALKSRPKLRTELCM